ncbi:hypothetical protein [Calycomorphotria hydatis]|uniref:GH10 domain-containing protein n=1 Tax=Calycomorphotria hydatis TaxID=2528027 RepID=A0A517TBP6_9PLAN|nr:hypothetical protein [Calycomorphotria hydatis]QDT65796.1 hypothetical protein V22_30580 [Calycomorphotria hydatis]
MGVLKFWVSDTDFSLIAHCLESAYFITVESIVLPTTVYRQDGIVHMERPGEGSVRLMMPWPVPEHGELVLCTGSLMQREKPYLLAVELARGKLVQLRDQISTWQMTGFEVPEDAAKTLSETHHTFAIAACRQDQQEEASVAAMKSISQTVAAMNQFIDAYTGQHLQAVKERTTTKGLPIAVLAELNKVPPEVTAKSLANQLSAARIDFAWCKVEPDEADGERNWETIDERLAWSEAGRLPVMGGPLLDFGPNGMPKRISAWTKDLANMQSFVCDYVESAISRYAGRIRRWEIATNTATGGGLDINEEQRLILTARALELATQIDRDADFFLRVDHPWGDYLARGQHRVSPMQFVDALVRSGIQLRGLTLEYSPNGAEDGDARRDAIEISRLVDHWARFGLPIILSIRMPAESDAHSGQQVDDMIRITKLMSAKSAVVAVECGRLTADASHSGIAFLDEQGEATTLFNQLMKADSAN